MDKTFNCDNCDISFARKYNLQRHLLKRKCKIINDNTDILSITSIDSEFYLDKKQDILKCEYCSKIFVKKYSLDRHLESNRGECYKIRNKFIQNNKMYKKEYNNCIINNVENQTVIQNITNVNIQPVVNNIILAKHGEETISHITKDVMLEILNIESFPKMCTELMRLLYFNKEVPENRNWTIVYPKNKNAGVEFNHETLRFEKKTNI